VGQAVYAGIDPLIHRPLPVNVPGEHFGYPASVAPVAGWVMTVRFGAGVNSPQPVIKPPWSCPLTNVTVAPVSGMIKESASDESPPASEDDSETTESPVSVASGSAVVAGVPEELQAGNAIASAKTI
jgi:hypothetical protein